MNNFIYENKTKVYFGKGGVKEYLSCLLKKYGGTVLLAYGGGSIKKNGVYDEVSAALKSAGNLPVLCLIQLIQRCWKAPNLSVKIMWILYLR